MLALLNTSKDIELHLGLLPLINLPFPPKRVCSIVLLAFCDATLAFNYVWTYNPGSTHDSTVLRHSDLFAHCNERIPPGFCHLGDSGCPSLGWLVTLFSDHWNLTRQMLFNKTHSRCEVTERALSMLNNRFEILDWLILELDFCK